MPDTQEMYLSEVLSVVAQAGLSPQILSPALERALIQWLEVLPIPIVIDALRKASGSAHPLNAFREIAFASLRQRHAQHAPRHSSVERPALPLPPGDLSEADRQALEAQFHLESLSDGEY